MHSTGIERLGVELSGLASATSTSITGREISSKMTTILATDLLIIAIILLPNVIAFNCHYFDSGLFDCLLETSKPTDITAKTTTVMETATSKIGKGSGKSTLKVIVLGSATLPAKSATYKVSLCSPLDKSVRVEFPDIV